MEPLQSFFPAAALSHPVQYVLGSVSVPLEDEQGPEPEQRGVPHAYLVPLGHDVGLAHLILHAPVPPVAASKACFDARRHWTAVSFAIAEIAPANKTDPARQTITRFLSIV